MTRPLPLSHHAHQQVAASLIPLAGAVPHSVENVCKVRVRAVVRGGIRIGRSRGRDHNVENECKFLVRAVIHGTIRIGRTHNVENTCKVLVRAAIHGTIRGMPGVAVHGRPLRCTWRSRSPNKSRRRGDGRGERAEGKGEKRHVRGESGVKKRERKRSVFC